MSDYRKVFMTNLNDVEIGYQTKIVETSKGTLRRSGNAKNPLSLLYILQRGGKAAGRPMKVNLADYGMTNKLSKKETEELLKRVDVEMIKKFQLN